MAEGLSQAERNHQVADAGADGEGAMACSLGAPTAPEPPSPRAPRPLADFDERPALGQPGPSRSLAVPSTGGPYRGQHPQEAALTRGGTVTIVRHRGLGSPGAPSSAEVEARTADGGRPVLPLRAIGSARC